MQTFFEFPYQVVKANTLAYFKSQQQQLKKLQLEVEEAINFINEVAEGKLDLSYANHSEDEINESNALASSLIRMKHKIKSMAEKESERNWIAEGLAKFADILRTDHQNFSELANTITAQLVKYMEVTQGALYIHNSNEQEEEYLELAACYAYDRRKFLQKKIAVGEGLLGQCFLEQESIYITDVPHDYLNITSGLGHANPRNLLLVPLKLNAKVFGIIELASFQIIPPYRVSFVEKLGESIASTISVSRINAHTLDLLHQTQIQAESMRSQEEELRQNMEELHATQEEIRRKTLVMESFTYAVDNSSIRIEFDSSGRVVHVNSRFCELTGYTYDEAVGQKHSFYVPKDVIVSGAFDQLWSDLSQGKHFVRDVKRAKKDGTLFWLRASYMPVFTEEGNLEKISCICFDITQEKEKEEASEAVKKYFEELNKEMRGRIKELEAQLQAVSSK